MKIEKTRKTRRTLVILEILMILTLFTIVASAAVIPPTNVHADLSGTALTVSWTKSTDINVTQYRIHTYNTTGTNNTQIKVLDKLVNASTTSIAIIVPSASSCYTAHIRSVAGTTLSTSAVSNEACNVIIVPDTVPPKSITGLKNVSYAQNYINWTWTNPLDSDFSKVMVYINGVFRTNVSSGNNSYNATGLNNDTIYNIGTRTVDTSGNINSTWVNATSRTAPGVVNVIIPPDPLSTSLTNIVLTVTANGGTPPYTYVWKGIPTLPIPCSGTNTNTITCSPTAPGTYGMTVTITDANNNIVTISNDVKVDSVPVLVLTGTVTDLNNLTYAQDYINWTWNNPTDLGFDHVDIYVDSGLMINVGNNQYYNRTGLTPNTEHTIHVRTVDINGDVNLTWVNSSSTTARDNTPPDSISGLHNTSYAPNYINWNWTNPSNTDFDHVDVYINGIFNGSVTGGAREYNATGLTANATYQIGTHTVDIYGNINNTWVNDTEKTVNILGGGSNGGLPTLRLMTIGDPHLSNDATSDAYKNLTKVVTYINGRSDVDLTVVLGDMASLSSAKTILDKLNKPYRVIAGNHDVTSISEFNTYFGFPAEHMEDFNGFQLIFVGINGTVNSPQWSFDFGTVSNKNKPTLIFNHGPVQPGKNLGLSCLSDWGSYYGYACDMKTETDKFTNLIGYYSGHVHEGTNNKIGKTLYVTEDNIGGAGNDSLQIGYTVVKNGSVESYTAVDY